MLTALLKDKYLSRYMVFTFLLLPFQLSILRSNLWQFTSFTSFSFTLSLYILINIVAWAYSYFEITAQSWYYTGG